MTTRVYLIRHGATTLSAEDRFAGATDVELSEDGRRQAELLGERLAPEPIAALYASPMRRTVETAKLACVHKVALNLDPGLREIDHGRWEGLTRAEVETRYAQEYADWEQDPYTVAPEGGESGASVIARALPVLRRIVLGHRGQTVMVISHKATIRLLLCGVLGIDPRGYRDRFDQSPACLNALDFGDPVRARLTVFNDITHYAAAPSRPTGRLSRWFPA